MTQCPAVSTALPASLRSDEAVQYLPAPASSVKKTTPIAVAGSPPEYHPGPLDTTAGRAAADGAAGPTRLARSATGFGRTGSTRPGVPVVGAFAAVAGPRTAPVAAGSALVALRIRAGVQYAAARRAALSRSFAGTRGEWAAVAAV